MSVKVIIGQEPAQVIVNGVDIADRVTDLEFQQAGGSMIGQLRLTIPVTTSDRIEIEVPDERVTTLGAQLCQIAGYRQ